MRHGLSEHAEATGPQAGARAGAVRTFERFLAGRELRLTPARRAILEAVLARDGHFPLEELIADMRLRGIRGSKATVYRTLPLLVEAGLLQPAVITGERRSYEGPRAGHHDHLVCRQCGAVVEFEFEAFEILQREIAARHGFRLEAHHHQLIGTCPSCLASERQAGSEVETISQLSRPAGRTNP